MAEYKFDEDSVKALIDWAKSTSFPQSVTLSDAENIVDVKRFVQANLSDIDAHYPDDFYNPAITRLYRLKEYMEENKSRLGTDYAESREAIKKSVLFCIISAKPNKSPELCPHYSFILSIFPPYPSTATLVAL